MDNGAWQPIETAPRDGTRVLLWVSGKFARAETAYYDLSTQDWWISDGTDILWRGGPATNWMPLPQPPRTSAGVSAGDGR